MSARHTTAQHRIGTNAGHITDSFTDYCLIRMKVNIKARVRDGTIYIKADDLADWYLARKAAKEQFGFQSIERE